MGPSIRSTSSLQTSLLGRSTRCLRSACYRGATYCASWILVGAIVLTLTGIYVVSSIKGQPIPPLWPRFYYALAVNGAWGLGTALFLKLFGEARKDTARA